MPSLSRRRFLTGLTTGVGTSLVLWSPVTQALDGGVARPAGADVLQVASLAAGEISLVRASDQLHVTFGFINLDVVGDELVPSGGGPSALRVTLGSQHTVEGSIDLGAGEPPPTTTEAVDGRGAGPSRVVVAVDAAVPFTVAGLMGLLSGTPLLDHRATGGVGSGAPSEDVTAIEVPADIALSPEADGRFWAEHQPIEVDGVTELWRLRVGTDDGDGGFVPAAPTTPTPVRAVHGGGEADLVDRPLDQLMRAELVEATTDWASVRYPDHEPLLARRLWLSLHGATAELSGAWTGTGTLAAYAEIIASGATLAAAVTTRGYLAPWGTPASVLEVTERRFEVAGDGSAVAVLDRREQLIIADAPVEYPATFMPDDGRRLPFASVRVLAGNAPTTSAEITWTTEAGTDRTIDPTKIFAIVDPDTGQERRFDHVAVDHAGHEVGFAGPCFFVTGGVAFATGAGAALADLADLYAEQTVAVYTRRRLDLDGQAVAFAEEADPGSGATTKATLEIDLALDRPVGHTQAELRAAGQPAFYPAMAFARISDETLDQLSGGNGPANVPVTYDPTWLTDGLGAANLGNAFLNLSNPFELDLGSTTDSGGLVAPVLSLDTFTQDLGVAMADVLTNGQWDPAGALGDAKLLGLIPLRDILGVLDLNGLDLASTLRLPSLRSLTLPDEVCQTFTWEPELQTWSLAGTDVFVTTADLGGDLDDPFDGPSAARVELRTCVGLEASAPVSSSVDVWIRNVVLQLPPAAPALAIQVTEVRWSAADDAPGTLDLDVAGYQFVGTIAFLEPFREFLATGPVLPSLEIDPDVGVDAEIRVSPPAFNLGVLRISEVWASLGLFVPFGSGGDTPFTTRFNVGSRDAPVAIGVMMFKGSASFALTLRPPPEGIVRFAASLTFGAEIAAGGIGVSGGIGFEVGAFIEYDETLGADGEVVVGGTFRLYGYIRVWAVAEVGVEARLELVFNETTAVLRATGTVIGWITVLGAHKEWELQVTETFDLDTSAGLAPGGFGFGRGALAAGPSTAGFADAYDVPAWTEYCGAFA